MILFATITGVGKYNDFVKGEPLPLYDEDHIDLLFEQLGNQVGDLEFKVTIFGASLNDENSPVELANYTDDYNEWINTKYTITKKFPNKLRKTR